MAIGIVKTINGVKQLVPLTTDSGQGLPLGAWTSFEDDKPRNGYLKAGTTFNQSDYPALYNMLGSNVVPDKGYGLDWDNAEAITLSTSDYVVQKNGWIVGYIYPQTTNTLARLFVNDIVVSRSYNASSWGYFANFQLEVKKGDVVKTEISSSVQDCHFVPYLHPMFIKAVIGPIEDSAADQVVQNINNSRSYSTEEVNTGKTWIDGKPIYSKTYHFENVSSGNQTLVSNVISTLSIDTVTAIYGIIKDSGGNLIPINTTSGGYINQVDINNGNIRSQTSATVGFINVTLEYTKTTAPATV